MACCHPPLHKIFEIFPVPLYMFLLQHETQLKKLTLRSEVNKLSITFRALWRKTNKHRNERTMESLKCTQFPVTNQLIGMDRLLRFMLKDDCKSLWQLNDVGSCVGFFVWLVGLFCVSVFLHKDTWFRTVYEQDNVSSCQLWMSNRLAPSISPRECRGLLSVCLVLVADLSFPPSRDGQITTYLFCAVGWDRFKYTQVFGGTDTEQGFSILLAFPNFSKLALAILPFSSTKRTVPRIQRGSRSDISGSLWEKPRPAIYPLLAVKGNIFTLLELFIPGSLLGYWHFANASSEIYYQFAKQSLWVLLSIVFTDN